MGEPVIIGYSLIPVGEYWDKDVVDLAAEAILKLSKFIDLKEVDALYVGNMLSEYLELQNSLSTHIAGQIGLEEIHTVDINVGDASGLYSVIEGAISILSGSFKFIIAGGVEKCTDALPARIYRGASLNEDLFYVDYSGVTNISLHGLAAKLYMKRYNLDRESISYMSILDHENASKSRHAQFRFPIKLESILNSPTVSDPLTLFDISPNADGAAFVLITDKDTAEEYGYKYVEIKSFASSNNYTRFVNREDPLDMKSSRRAFEKAIKKASISLSDVGFMELHDTTSIAGLLLLESFGIHKKGESWMFVKDGYHSLDGELPLNTFGGLKARGNPLGATGAYAVVEAVMQLFGEAGDNQVKEPRVGIVHSMNGFDNSASVMVLGGV
jgi:acetyl-CoA C-acetyltransferase